MMVDEDLVPVDSTVVRFQGHRTGTARATWAQQAIWEDICWLGEEAHYYNFRCVVAVPAETTVDGVRSALGRLVTGCETLRTRYSDSPDGLRQRLVQAGELTVPIYRAPS